MTTTPEIVIYVRHSPGCKYEGDESARRCDCRKWLRWTQSGQRHRKPTGTRSWQEAEKFKRELEDQLSGKAPAQDTGTGKYVADAVKVFIQDKTVQGVSAGVLGKYKLELGRLAAYCDRHGALVVSGITRELLTGYAATWLDSYPSSYTRSKVRERCSAFLRYCYECQWLPRVPKLPKVKVDEPPTMPLQGDEYPRLLDALYVVNPRRWDSRKSTRGLTDSMRARLHALIQLMRWSGLAIRDALSLPKTGLEWDSTLQTYRVVTSRQKTGTHVSVVLPPDVSKELGRLSEAHPVYVLFPDAELDFYDLARTYTNRYIRPAFEAANIPCDTHMVSHRLRDTFAVHMLIKGMSIEEVAAALGDTVKTVEKHYAKWVQGRQSKLDNSIAGTWDQPQTKLRLVAGG